VLKSVYLDFRKVNVQRVVECGMYNRSGDGVGCFEVKVGANAHCKVVDNVPPHYNLSPL